MPGRPPKGGRNDPPEVKTWEVSVRIVRTGTVTVEATSAEEAAENAMDPALWLDETHGETVDWRTTGRARCAE